MPGVHLGSLQTCKQSTLLLASEVLRRGQGGLVGCENGQAPSEVEGDADGEAHEQGGAAVGHAHQAPLSPRERVGLLSCSLSLSLSLPSLFLSVYQYEKFRTSLGECARIRGWFKNRTRFHPPETTLQHSSTPAQQHHRGQQDRQRSLTEQGEGKRERGERRGKVGSKDIRRAGWCVKLPSPSAPR